MIKLIVGLGNPGDKYNNTRHNIGFMIIDNYLNKNNISNWKEKFGGLYVKKKFNHVDVIFSKPLTHMNRSGDFIKEISNFYKIREENILIIYDDTHFDMGTFKLKVNNSSGGHNGVESIISHFKDSKFKRLRVGIGEKKGKSLSDFVLKDLSKKDYKILENNFEIYNEIISDYILMDFIDLQGRYN